MSKSRAKGTRWETELLGRLRTIWPHAERAPIRGAHDHGDYTSVDGWLIEAKSTIVPKFLEWARICRGKCTRQLNPGPWAIIWHGDRRGPDGKPLVLLELDDFLDLLASDAVRRGGALDPKG